MMFTILEDSSRAGLIEKLDDVERNFNVKAFDFSVVKRKEYFDFTAVDVEVFTALVQYERRSTVKPQPLPSRGW